MLMLMMLVLADDTIQVITYDNVAPGHIHKSSFCCVMLMLLMQADTIQIIIYNNE